MRAVPPPRVRRPRPGVHPDLARPGRRPRRGRARHALHRRREHRPPGLRHPDGRLRLAAGAAARRARPLARHRQRGPGPLHDRRRLARRVRASRVRRPQLRAQGARVPEGHRPAAARAAAPSSWRSTSTPATTGTARRSRRPAGSWSIRAPHRGGPFEFRDYVQGSGAEFSVAQGIYVETRSGWFSDRTVRYLASGKPALVQDTGFSDNYPAGEGLVAFTSPEDAAA